MKIRSLVFVIALLALVVAGKFVYDGYQEYEHQKKWETQLPDLRCSLCAAHKEDMELMREKNARRPIRE